QRFMERLSELPLGATAIDRLRLIAHAFLPADDESRTALGFYHAIGGAALTDPDYRGDDFHHNAALLHGVYVDVISAGQQVGDIDPGLDSHSVASLIAGTVTGLSIHSLIDHGGVSRAVDAIDLLLSRIVSERPPA
ncbi:MAG: hypothetical protein GX542_10060, partial [Rhodococcus sp.]|nr:hypothetical protein [Rhodococcus sp. (in: high G+C Gram-positive bacteria)]